MSRNIEEDKLLMDIPVEYSYEFDPVLLDPRLDEEQEPVRYDVKDEYSPKSYDEVPNTQDILSIKDLNSNLDLSDEELKNIVQNNQTVLNQVQEEVQSDVNKVEQAEPYQGLNSHVNMIGGRYGILAAQEEAKKL